jgi:hypothetical protein
MKYAVVEQLRLQYSIKDLCSQMDASESGYYSWRSRPLSQRQQDDKRLVALRGIFKSLVANFPFKKQRQVKFLFGNIDTNPLHNVTLQVIDACFLT